ncbi:hypothetical protein BU26DRAFT_251562 [Trematosphaeria pertusa]|uniref:Uncharacterized protein n=1 Tax=Trematosphaeria pertusa TaxID=390896 RepID=A0A6A6IPF9_9PLEO|nr:uncharacterized protein BU26DRAFT_251562 [Trematosphaeria pertusa]KAF2252127.1 hypothetical protein BU26DRAFT_251562 [Trematosphaeria pertusa]
MALDHIQPKPISDHKQSTVYTCPTPPESTTPGLLEDLDDLDPLHSPKSNGSSVPWPGSTFIISSVSTGHAIALRGGQVVLAPPGGRESIHWECVETKGWLGFRNPVSGKFLGHDGRSGKLRCSGRAHEGWEWFCVRQTPEGGYVLLMTHWEKLWPVGTMMEGGEKVLAKVENAVSDGIVWKFIKV